MSEQDTSGARPKRPDAKATPSPRAKPANRKTSGEFSPEHRMAIALTNSVALGVVITAIVATALPTVGGRIGVRLDSQQLMGTSALAFTVTTLMAYLLFNRFYQRRDRLRRLLADAERAKLADKKPRTWAEMLDRQLESFEPIFKPAAPSPAAAPAATEASEAPNKFGLDSDPTPFEAAVFADTAPVAEDPAAPEPATPATPRPPAGPHHMMARFVARILATDGAASLMTDRHLALGAHLFLSGGCGALAKSENWDPARGAAELALGLQALGAPQGYSRDFAAAANAFSQGAKLRPLIDAGATAMATLALDARSGFPELQAELPVWSQQRLTVQAPEIACVMAISIDVTNTQDDKPDKKVVQNRVRRCKAVAGEAIELCGGSIVNEIENGLAAHFAITDMAVRAALRIQEAVATQVKSSEQLSVSLQIGLDTGLAVCADDQFISPALWNALRFIGRARPREIICSAATYGETLQQKIFEPRSIDPENPAATLYSLPWNAADMDPEIAKLVLEYRHIGTVDAGRGAARRAKQTADAD